MGILLGVGSNRWFIWSLNGLQLHRNILSFNTCHGAPEIFVKLDTAKGYGIRVIASFQIAAIHGSAEYHFGLRRNAKFDKGIFETDLKCWFCWLWCPKISLLNGCALYILILSTDQWFFQIILIFHFIFMPWLL